MTQVSEVAHEQDLCAVAQTWIQRFEQALTERDAEALNALFQQDSYWRDLIAFTGHIRPFYGRDVVVEQLLALSVGAGAQGFGIDPDQTVPSLQPRGNGEVLEVFIRFQTDRVIAKGVVRLSPADNDLGYAAVALMTAAQELVGFESPIGPHRRDHAVSHQFSGPNWQDHLDEVLAFKGRNPEVVVIGGGQAGLTVAAHLHFMGADVLVIEQNPRVGDNWRNRYHSLILHNMLAVNKLPYMPFPETFPEYLPKDMFGGWLETYATSMEVPVWTNTRMISGDQNEKTGEWVLQIERNGEEQTLRTRQVVVATGGAICARPNLPDMPGLDQFGGDVKHTSQIDGGEEFAGKRVVVFGTGTSGHDVATQLVENGADVTMVQRSATNVVSQPTANLYLQMFQEREPEEVDLIVNTNDLATTRAGFQEMTKIAAELDRDLVEGLNKAGFRTNDGIEDAGYFWNFLHRGGGYYINVGGSDQIIEGRIKLIQNDDIATFAKNGLYLKDGSVLEADTAVFATGYGNQSAQVRELFGDRIADAVGPIWGFGEDGEIRNTWRPTPMDGLWFVGGGVPHARNYGRYVALQIKGRLEGWIAGTDVSAPNMWVR